MHVLNLKIRMTLVSIFSIWRSGSNLQVIHFKEICHITSTIRSNLTPGPKWTEVNRGLHPLLIRRNVALLQWVMGKARKGYLFQINIHLLNLINPSTRNIIFISWVSSAYFSEKFSPSSPSPLQCSSSWISQFSFQQLFPESDWEATNTKAWLWCLTNTRQCDANNKRHCSVVGHLTTLTQLIQAVRFLCFPLHDSVVNVKTEDAQVLSSNFLWSSSQSRLLEHLWVSWWMEHRKHINIYTL